MTIQEIEQLAERYKERFHARLADEQKRKEIEEQAKAIEAPHRITRNGTAILRSVS